VRRPSGGETALILVVPMMINLSLT